MSGERIENKVDWSLIHALFLILFMPLWLMSFTEDMSFSNLVGESDMKNCIVALLFVFTLASGMLLFSGDAEAKSCLWYGYRSDWTDVWMMGTPCGQSGPVPTEVQAKINSGVTVYWVECADSSCSSARTAVRNHFRSTGGIADWRFQVK